MLLPLLEKFLQIKKLDEFKTQEFFLFLYLILFFFIASLLLYFAVT